MVKKIYLFTIILTLCISALSQTTALSFTGKDANDHWVRLNRVIVTNMTKNWSETVVWPDTVLTIENGTGIYDVEAVHAPPLQLFQNHPNPFNGTTDVLLAAVDAGAVTMEIADVNGRIAVPEMDISTIVRANNYSPRHLFRITLAAAGTYVMTVRQNGKTASIKMVNNGGGNGNGVEYVGIVGANDHSPLQFPTPKSHARGAVTRPFDFGDVMEYTGYAAINGRMDTVTVSQPLSDSQEIVMMFEGVQTDGLPCLGIPTLTDINGNVYHTVLVGSQCWMRENLRATKFPDNTEIATGTYTSSDPFYYDDSESDIPLAERGSLYNWSAAMHGAASSSAVPSGVQGICPNGWHLPSEAEWEVLIDYVSAQPEYICGETPDDIAKSVSSEFWWNSYNGGCNPGDQRTSPNNATGFSAIPAGTLGVYGYDDAGFSAHFWSSTENSGYSAAAIYYSLDYDTNGFLWATTVKERRASVRCISD